MKGLCALLVIGFCLSAASGKIQDVTKIAKLQYLKSRLSSLDMKSMSPEKLEILIENFSKQIELRNNSQVDSQTDNDETLEENRRCLFQLGEMATGITAAPIQPWAVMAFDSWSKIQSGFLMGNILNMGHYDQCIRTFNFFDDSLGNWTGEIVK